MNIKQTRPIRGATGADITEKTLQKTLGDIGIDRSIKDLSYVEKRLIMVVSLSKQLKVSQGDYARTIESTSNQIRIMQEQWSRLGRAVGNIFYPVLEAILPYVNAILMVLVEIANVVAGLLGFKMPEFDYSGLTSASDSTSDLIDGMDEASASAEKLKTGLRGFDKLNNISTSSGNDSSASSGVDPAIMDAFNDSFSSYNDMMDEVNMKANKIRDAILDWLGFTDGTYKNLKLIGAVLGTIVGFKLITGIAGLITGTSRLGKILGTGGLYKTLLKLSELSGIKSVFGAVSVALSGVTLAFIGLYIAIQGVIDLFNGNTFDGIIKVIEGIALVVAGVAIVFDGWVVALIAGAVALTAFLTKLTVDNWAVISQFFVDIWNGFYSIFVKPLVDFITGIADFIYKYAIKPIIDFFAPIVSALVDIFLLIVKNVTDIVLGIGTALWSIITKVIEIGLKIVEIFVALGVAFYTYVIKPIIDFFIGIATWVWNNAIRPILNFFGTVAQWFYDKIISPIWNKIVWLKDKAVNIFKSIGKTVVNFVSNAFKSVINGILWTIENTINGFIKLLNGAIKLINKIPGVNIKTVTELKIPRLKTGMDFVPNDFYGPVYLDYGERVLTKDENYNYNKNSNTSNIGNNGLNNQSTNGIQNATFVIQVGSEEIGKVVLKDLNKMAKSNGEPIVIGG